MNKAGLPPLAVIADAHVHDINSDYDFGGTNIEGQQLTLRSWADTRRSSRVFNESKAALMHALHDIDKRGIKHVVLLGDYTDDGQIEATTRFTDLLHTHSDQYGTQFFAITGNHDAYGPLGKHQSTRFASGASKTVLVTSDPKVAATEPDTAILTPKMYCEGVAVGISKMSEFGLFKQPGYVHWESPFGLSDSIENRQYDASSDDGLRTHTLVDASYLVEPVQGLWLLMIDANVFEPRNGQWKPNQKKAFLDSSDAGWNSVLKNRPYLIDWIRDVCARAKQYGKTVMAFSHYPVTDAFADQDNNAFTLFGDHEMLRRKPGPEASDALLSTGLHLHFSGHLHVNASSQVSKGHVMEECAVPSLVTFPAAYKVVTADTNTFNIETINLSSMPLDPRLMNFYRDEALDEGEADIAAFGASTYGEFLYHRMRCRVVHHFLQKEWPKDIAVAVLNTTTLDLWELMSSDRAAADVNAPATLTNRSPSEQKTHTLAMAQHELSCDDLATCSMSQLIADWYCFRHAGNEVHQFTDLKNIKIYSYLAEQFGDLAPAGLSTQQAFFATFLGMLGSYVRRSSRRSNRSTK